VFVAAIGVALVAIAPVLSATAALSPKALYKALLTAHLPESELPPGFSSPRTKAKPPGPNTRRYHVVGEVEIDLNSGRARIVYVIFPTRADAVGKYTAGLRGLRTTQGVTKVHSPAPGFRQPSVIITGSANGVGVTQVSFLAKSVEINAQTLRPNAESGDVKKTLTLAHFALQHLKTVERRTAS
jgi:hypothetical protein